MIYKDDKYHSVNMGPGNYSPVGGEENSPTGIRYSSSHNFNPDRSTENDIRYKYNHFVDYVVPESPIRSDRCNISISSDTRPADVNECPVRAFPTLDLSPLIKAGVKPFELGAPFYRYFAEEADYPNEVIEERNVGRQERTDIMKEINEYCESQLKNSRDLDSRFSSSSSNDLGRHHHLSHLMYEDRRQLPNTSYPITPLENIRPNDSSSFDQSFGYQPVIYNTYKPDLTKESLRCKDDRVLLDQLLSNESNNCENAREEDEECLSSDTMGRKMGTFSSWFRSNGRKSRPHIEDIKTDKATKPSGVRFSDKVEVFSDTKDIGSGTRRHLFRRMFHHK